MLIETMVKFAPRPPTQSQRPTVKSILRPDQTKPVADRLISLMLILREVVKKRIFYGQADLTVSKCENFDPYTLKL